MARPDGSATDSNAGFEGGIAGLELADLIQLNARNRFSGCFKIQHEENLGLIFFRDGEIIHAEQGPKAGEEAICDILGWPRGHFSVEPNLVAARRTIQKKCEHLLLDAHRVLDERRARRETVATPPPPLPRPPTAGAAVQVVRGLPGVADAVLLTKDGKRQGEDGYEAEVLAGQTVYLAMVAAELGALFQAGEMRGGSVQGSRQHLLLFATKTHYLGVFAQPDQEPAAVEAAIRGALSKSR